MKKLGGKTVWLKPYNYPWNVYYAHLDKQKVVYGQEVKKGDIIGTVGNTGNAKTTPSHLHFGIYNYAGPINPLPYVKTAPKILNKNIDSKKIITTLPIAKKVLVTNKKIWASTSPKKNVWKQLIVPSSDPSVKYFITMSSSVVLFKNGKNEVVGKMEKDPSGVHAYNIDMFNGKKIFISNDGKLLNANGVVIGTVVTINS